MIVNAVKLTTANEVKQTIHILEIHFRFWLANVVNKNIVSVTKYERGWVENMRILNENWREITKKTYLFIFYTAKPIKTYLFIFLNNILHRSKGIAHFEISIYWDETNDKNANNKRRTLSWKYFLHRWFTRK